MPVLIMPYINLLPALWDALCIMSHGDLSESNILINFEKNIFHLIDPGILLTSPIYGDLYVNYESIFTTNGANYPLFPPFINLRIPPTQKNINSVINLLNQLHFWGNNRETNIFNVNYRCSNSFSNLAPNLTPTVPDLLALGIMYFRILTGKELFLGREILPNKPAWECIFGEHPEVYGIYENVCKILGQNYINNELNKYNFTLSERNLLSSLLNLEISSREQLLNLVEEITA
jgi:serine/threonine protein kinase